MAKIRKAIFRNGIVMLSLLASVVLSSSVAYAQDCGIQVLMPTQVRAEGMTEVVGDIELRCVPAAPVATPGFGMVAAPVPDLITISVQLNAGITNAVDLDGNVEVDSGADNMAPSYDADELVLDAVELDGNGRSSTEIMDSAFGDGEVDGGMITWEIDTNGENNISNPFNLLEVSNNDPGLGFSVFFRGIRANASAVGDGEDITANVYIEGTAVNSAPIKVADVSTGLDVKSDALVAISGLQCRPGEEQTVIIRFVEGFASAFTDDHELVLHLGGIPDGVTVTPSDGGTGMAMNMVTSADLAPVSLESGTDSDGNVDLTAAGSGAVVYAFDNEEPSSDALEGTDADLAEEWNDVTLTFEWEAGSENTGLGSATVSVSFNPVGGDDVPRYVQGATMDVLEIDDCVTSMVFPFVTNMHNYDTGIALTNTSGGAGSCMLEYSGTNAPADTQMMMVGAEGTATFTVSTRAPMFQGYINATCDFLGGQGFAFLTNGFGYMGGPTLAQGYLAVPAERK